MFVVVHQRGPDGRPMLRLLVESGPLQGKMFKLSGSRSSVGKAPDNVVPLPLPQIADYHFDIEIVGEQILLRDRSSGMGTWVNDQPVDVIELKHGDRIALGQSEVHHGANAAPSVVPSSPFAAAPGIQEIFLAEHSVNLAIDDVRTVLGSPLARWGTTQPPQPRQSLRPPPGSATSPAPTSEQANWQQRKLEVLLAVGKALSRPEEISEKIGRVLELLFDTMDIDRAAILVLATEGESQQEEESSRSWGSVGQQDGQKQQIHIGTWTFSWSAYRDQQGAAEPMPLSSTVIQKVLTDAVAVMTQDAQAEDWLDGARSVFGQAIRTCICTPLKTATGVLGVLYVDSARTSHPFRRDDMEFFTAFSNQAAIAIENTRLLQAALQKERMQQDLRVAKRIQRWLFPREVPTLPGYELAGDSLAMEEVGGDYFDYILLDARRLALVVGDVSGHGISSALVMTMTRSILRGSLVAHTQIISPADILQRVNQLVSDDMMTRMFVTMLLLIIDLETGQFIFSNAGHNPPLLFRSHAKQMQLMEVKRSGPLGMSRWARLKPVYENHQDVLYPGDILCIYTDGFPEATNPAGEEMGLQPLQDVIAYHALYPSTTILRQAFVRLHHFMAGSSSTDDTTAIILKRQPIGG